jgi:hypothetical protein
MLATRITMQAMSTRSPAITVAAATADTAKPGSPKGPVN